MLLFERKGSVSRKDRKDIVKFFAIAAIVFALIGLAVPYHPAEIWAYAFSLFYLMRTLARYAFLKE